MPHYAVGWLGPCPLDQLANWSSTESKEKAVKRYECELDHARGAALVRNLW